MYTPIPAIRRSSIEPGDDVTIDVFLSGQGNIHQNKLTIIPSSDELIDVEVELGDVDWENVFSEGTTEDDIEVEEDAGEISCLYYAPVVAKNDQGIEKSVGTIGKLYKRDFHGASTTVSLSDISFNLLYESSSSSNQMQVTPTESLYHSIERESDLPEGTRIDDDHPSADENSIAPQGHPPIRLTFSSNENVSPGDYQIHFIFTYFDGIIMQSSRNADIHVKTWVERNNEYLRKFAIILSIIIVILSLITMVATVIAVL